MVKLMPMLAPDGEVMEAREHWVPVLLKRGFKHVSASKRIPSNLSAPKADINVVGLFLEMCGYSIIAEQLILGLDDAGYKVRVIPWGNRPVQTSWMTVELEEIMGREYALADKTLFMCPLSFWGELYKMGKTFVFTMFETDRIPSADVSILNSLDGLILPCRQNVEAFEASGVKTPTSQSHLCIEYSDYDRPLLKHKNFVFFSHGTHSVWKGSDLMSIAFMKAFPKEKDVRLVLKDIPQKKNYGIIWDSRIKRIAEYYPPKEMIKAIASSDCGLFPSRGEGWGLGAMEFMALGLPVILTDWGGLAEMCNRRYNYPLKISGMSPARNYFFSKLSRYWDAGDWAEPDLDKLVQLMRHVYKHQKEARRKGSLAAKWVRRRFTNEVLVRNIVKAMGIKKGGGKIRKKLYKVVKNPLQK